MQAVTAFLPKTACPYTNLFHEIGISDNEVEKKIGFVWNNLFFGDSNTRIYFPTGNNMGYIYDTGNHDVRTEGMSYGMMLAVQMDQKNVFDRLWKWTKTYMYLKTGIHSGYFAWSVRPDGVKLSSGPAPDGEEYFAMALLFASHRWGDSKPPFDYSDQARSILHAMLHTGEDGIGFPMINPDNHLILFVPGCFFSDPSYHLPHFYRLFAQCCNKSDYVLWKKAAEASDHYLQSACHPKTGMAADYAEFDGTPRIQEGHEYFYSDAYRVTENIALDSLWFGKQPWQSAQANAIQKYFLQNGLQLDNFKVYETNGKKIDRNAMHPYGLLSTLSCASVLTEQPLRQVYLQAFWKLPLRHGERRYYDNCLYFFALLMLSGHYKIY
jgi:oligosaccharide reducing-end xylanase